MAARMSSDELTIPRVADNRAWSFSATIVDAVFPNIWIWIASALLLLIDLAWIAASPRISVSSDSFIWMLAPLAAVFLLASIRHANLPVAGSLLTRITSAGMVFLFVLLTLPGLRILNHLLMTLPFPMADGLLVSWDEAFGFQWLDYAEFIAGNQFSIVLMKYAYKFLYFAVIAVALEASLAGNFSRCQELLALTVMSAVTASLISCLFPARAAMDYYANEALRLQFDSNAGIFHLKQLMALRGSDPIILEPTALAGLSTFPSFHSAAGILIVYSCRGNSLRLAVGTAYSAIMIASTPLFGGHYFVDLIAGTALAIAMIMLWRMYGKNMI
jgi:hypothetical protein